MPEQLGNEGAVNDFLNLTSLFPPSRSWLSNLTSFNHFAESQSFQFVDDFIFGVTVLHQGVQLIPFFLEKKKKKRNHTEIKVASTFVPLPQNFSYDFEKI